MTALSVLMIASAAGWWFGTARRSATPDVRVVDVLDGDTIVVALPGGGRDTVRLLGVDTPETHHPTKPVGCYGPEAAAFTQQRLAGRVVTLEGDVESRDLYGRRLAYVLLHGERFNDVLLRRGFARLLVIAPNRSHAHELLAAELAARDAGRGLWGRCEP